MVTKMQGEQRPGRRPSLDAVHTATLRAIAQEQPRSSLGEVTRELSRRAGIKVSTVIVRKALREAGMDRLKPLRRAGERASGRRSKGPRRSDTGIRPFVAAATAAVP